MANATAERLRALDTAALSDALDRVGIDGVVAGISPLRPGAGAAGRAVTVKLGPTEAGAAARHLATAAVEHAGSDDVIVIAHPGPPDVAGWGGNLQLAAAERAVSGVVVDGPVRDVDDIRSGGPAVFARGATPRSARGRLREDSWNESIVISGIPVRPGDLVIADGSGVVIVPAERAEEVIAQAEEIASGEDGLARRIVAGEPVSAVLGTPYERQLARR
jgi:4-hydroxy-4-methyl-2-oxoglutarate aldolase